MSDQYREKAVFFVQKAIESEQSGNSEEAFALYLQSFEWFQMALKYEKNPKTIEKIKQKLFEYVKRAEELKPQKEKKESFQSLAVKPNVKWDDVCGLEDVKNLLKETVIMPIRFPYIYTDGLRPWKGILLYGPPGTGKSFLAKAVATEANATFFSVSAADLVSKWVGESEKHVKELFETARERKPSIIFLDEVESLCAQREESSSASLRLLTEFLVQMDGLGNSMDGILVLGATNLPWMLDVGIRRRFEQRIYIPLPDREARLKMFGGVQKYADLTEGYSGADISIVINKAKMQPIRITQTATHFKYIKEISPVTNVEENDMLIPCSPGDPDAVSMTWMEIKPGKLLIPKVKKNDYIKSIQEVKPSVNQKDLVRYEEWTRDFGSE